MAIYDTTQLLSKGASVKLLTDRLAQAEKERRGLLEALEGMLLAYEGDAGDTDSPACIKARAAIEQARSN